LGAWRSTHTAFAEPILAVLKGRLMRDSVRYILSFYRGLATLPSQGEKRGDVSEDRPSFALWGQSGAPPAAPRDLTHSEARLTIET